MLGWPLSISKNLTKGKPSPDNPVRHEPTLGTANRLPRVSGDVDDRLSWGLQPLGQAARCPGHTSRVAMMGQPQWALDVLPPLQQWEEWILLLGAE